MSEARVLIVEDENIVAVDIQDRLEHLGYEVVGHATTGRDAIRLVEETVPDLVLMDIMLKGEMDGVEAAEHIRREFDIPIIFLTAYADAKTLHRAKTTQPYGYIIKPFEEREVHSTVEMAVYRHQMGRKLRESQRWLSTVLRSIGEGVITTDMDGSVTFMNPHAEQLTGRDLEQAKGKPISRVLRLIDMVSRSPMENIFPCGETGEGFRRGACLLIAPGGVEVPVSLSASCIRDDRNHDTGVVIVIQDISEQKRAEEEIRQAKDRAELIYRVTPSAIFTVDRHCTVTTWNDRAKEITGYTPDEAIGRKCWFFEDCPTQCLFFPEGEVVMPVTGLAGIITTKDGERRFVSRNLDYLSSASGTIIGGIESFEDVTERMKAEAELRESELKFRSVVHTAGDAIILSDSQGKVLFWNRGAEMMFGYRSEEILGRSVSVLMPERLQRLHNAGMVRIANGEAPKLAGKSLELTGLRKDGSEFPVELSVTTWEAKGEVFASGIIRDISERKEAEEALESTLSELNIIFENATVGIAFVLKGRIVRVNRRFEEMFGYSRNEAEGQPPGILFPSPEGFSVLRQQSRATLAAGGTFGGEHAMRRKDATVFWGELVGKSIDPHDLSKGSIWILEDITDRKRAQDQMQAAKEAAEQASRSKSEFLANMSHEIRTPMNGILGMVELILETSLTHEQHEYISIVKQSADNLLSLLNDVLDFSKIEAGRLELESTGFNLRAVLYSTVETIGAQAHRKGLDLLCRIAPEVPLRLVGDPGRLRQVLGNLLGNAIKFTDAGSIEVGVGIAREMAGAGEARDVVLHFTVRDTGVGIPGDKLGVIFESFTQADGSTTRKYGGTGLGLTISKQIVQLMGGDIWVESEPDKGSTFHFTAKFKIGAKAKGPVVPEAEHDFGGVHALLVGKGETGPDTLSRMLHSWGFRTFTAQTGEDALDTARRAVMPFDLVLVDCNRIGRDPFELIRELRESPRVARAATVLIMPAGLRGDAARCREFGISAYLHRPFTMSDLMDAISRSMMQDPDVEHDIVTQYTRRERDGLFHVLVAEDNTVNQKLAERILAREGVSVRTVRNGLEALKALTEERFDAVLMDVQMPEMDGMAATRAIRDGRVGKENSRIPIVALTAHALGGDREKFLASGMDAYVAKPFKASELMGTLMRVVTGGPKPVAAGAAGEGARQDDGGHVIDEDRALSLLDGDRELLYEIWQDFIDGGGDMVAAIEAAIGSGDRKTLEREAHSMKSTAGSIGAEGLRKHALALETAAREGKTGEYHDLYVNIHDEFDRVVQALTAKLPGNTGG